MKMVLEQDFDTFDESRFTAEFCKLAGIDPSNFKIVKKERGSVKLDLELGGNDTLRQIRTAMGDQIMDFAYLKIKEVKLGEFDLNIDENKMDPAWNREYCKGKTYWKGAVSDRNDRGNYPYYCPVGKKNLQSV